MSPSAAMKTSSPWDKNTFLVSPVRLAKPKNLSVIGGGGGIGGNWRTLADCASVTPGPLGVGITAIDPATKIFLPLPAYLISSLWLSRFRSSVGSSRGSTTGTIFPEAVRRVAGLAGVAAVCVPAGATDVDEGQNS